MTLPTRAGLRSRAKFFRFCSEHQKIATGLKFLVAESVFEINPLKSKKYRFLDQSLEKKYLRGPLSIGFRDVFESALSSTELIDRLFDAVSSATLYLADEQIHDKFVHSLVVIFTY